MPACKACEHNLREAERLKDQLSTVIMMANQRLKIAEDGRKALEERFQQMLDELKALRRLSGINLEALTLAAPRNWEN